MDNTRGITLIEIMIVIGMSAFIIAMGGFIGLESIRSASPKTDQALLVDALLLARARSQSNGTYGVFIDTDTFTVFTGEHFEERDTYLDFPISRLGTESAEGAGMFLFRKKNTSTEYTRTLFGNGPWYETSAHPSGAITLETFLP